VEGRRDVAAAPGDEHAEAAEKAEQRREHDWDGDLAHPTVEEHLVRVLGRNQELLAEGERDVRDLREDTIQRRSTKHAA